MSWRTFRNLSNILQVTFHSFQIVTVNVKHFFANYPVLPQHIFAQKHMARCWNSRVKFRVKKKPDCPVCRVFHCIPREQEGRACAQRTDEMNCQFASLVVEETQTSLNVLQRADVVRPSPAGIDALSEHQPAPDVSADLTRQLNGACLRK